MSSSEPRLRSVLLSGFWDSPGFIPAERLRRAQLNYRTAFSLLCDGLLVHDQIIVPTSDLFVVVPLLDRLGGERLGRLLDSGAMRIVRIRPQMAYFFGNGLANFERPTALGTYPESAPLSVSIDLVLDAWRSHKGRPASNRLRRSLLANTFEVDFGPLLTQVREHTNALILQDPRLREQIGDTTEALNALGADAQGEGSMTATVWAPQRLSNVPPKVRMYLDIAQASSELVIANRIKCDDVSSLAHFESSLALEQRAMVSRTMHSEATLELKEIADVPDVASAIDAGHFTLEQLCDLRESAGGRAFRRWFHENARSESPATIAKEYIELIRQTNADRSFVGRVLRFIVGRLLGDTAAKPIAELSTPFVTFLANRSLAAGSALFFIDRLRTSLRSPDETVLDDSEG